MLFSRIESEGLSHYSYLFGTRGEAAVIDPRRDCEEYIEQATAAGMRITHIFETHRNEDYCIGSVELAARTGAQIWHADSQLDYGYGKPVTDGAAWQIGSLRLRAMHTPGHTPGSVSYVLDDKEGSPWAVFTGDTLFAGDVGRVDLLSKEQSEELAGQLYDSLYNKILPLGDGILVCPAHGPGSVCGTAIADRPWTTIGQEKDKNPRLKFASRDEFIVNTAMMLERPPYFLQMEKLNVEGAPLLGTVPQLKHYDPQAFRKAGENAVVLDVRSDISFSGAHVPGAISIWLGGLSGFAGWFLPYDKPILLIAEQHDLEIAVRQLIRLGFDNVLGTLSGGMLGWHTAGFASESVDTIIVQQLCRSLDDGLEPWILDVRTKEELDRDGRIPGAHHVHLTQLPRHLKEIPQNREVYIFCASGLRSMVAASLLKREGMENIVVVLGGLAGWSSTTCPIEK
ncbi:MBL fold metallo-hydrolase [Dethiobacter alkaliphilus]|uniref:MBL fold metallo-hydrolase n=1 Tax=Dethiobacter alkaliphilus TaxID=427926 RepID=UPI002227BD92|nr:MBL fold metallo-hydrolase [Dethiobacter alkaliphilus]MCW3489404.1 MBL fold metallo-hydrolase [Dethiobacter alkaliphilus]